MMQSLLQEEFSWRYWAHRYLWPFIFRFRFQYILQTRLRAQALFLYLEFFQHLQHFAARLFLQAPLRFPYSRAQSYGEVFIRSLMFLAWLHHCSWLHTLLTRPMQFRSLDFSKSRYRIRFSAER